MIYSKLQRNQPTIIPNSFNNEVFVCNFFKIQLSEVDSYKDMKFEKY